MISRLKTIRRNMRIWWATSLAWMVYDACDNCGAEMPTWFSRTQLRLATRLLPTSCPRPRCSMNLMFLDTAGVRIEDEDYLEGIRRRAQGLGSVEYLRYEQN